MHLAGASVSYGYISSFPLIIGLRGPSLISESIQDRSCILACYCSQLPTFIKHQFMSHSPRIICIRKCGFQ